MNLSVAVNEHRLMIKGLRLYLLSDGHQTQIVLMLVVFIILGAQLQEVNTNIYMYNR